MGKPFNPETVESDWPDDPDNDANVDWAHFVLTIIGIVGAFSVLIAFVILLWLASLVIAWPKDDGRYANSPLKKWFDQLASGKGLCCSFADGVSVQDVDWDTQDGRYRVRLYGEWIVVPPDSVVTEPNRFGPAVVWPYCSHYEHAPGDGAGIMHGVGLQIRCFLPGAGA